MACFVLDDGRSVTNLFVREMQTNEIHEKSIFFAVLVLIGTPSEQEIL